MSRGASYQLPDLPSLVRDFDLRTNPHCHQVSLASENWFLNFHHLEEPILDDERDEPRLRGMKAGLLAALCFPTCDAPQLRLMADFMTAILCIHVRLAKAHHMKDCGWLNSELDLDTTSSSGWDVLDRNILLAPLVLQLKRLSIHASSEWSGRFANSVLGFRQAQQQLILSRNAHQDDIEAYVGLRVDASGLRIMLELTEIVKELKLPSNSRLLELHTRSALNIMIWSSEMVSYSLYSSANNDLNAVSLTMSLKEIALQGALKVCMARLKEHVTDFRNIERAILSELSGPPPRAPPPPSRSHGPSNSIWNLLAFTRTPPPPATGIEERPPLPMLDAEGWDEDTKEDVRSYVGGLKDCVVGYINWMYETEIYFGKLGEEVRATGWTFLPSPAS